jgi:hypothetical protein
VLGTCFAEQDWGLEDGELKGQSALFVGPGI